MAAIGIRVSVRGVLTGLAIAFTSYLAVTALVWTRPVQHPALFVGCVVLFVATSLICVLLHSAPAVLDAAEAAAGGHEPIGGEIRRRAAVPLRAAILALVTSVLTPTGTWAAVAAEYRLAPFATWSMGAIGALMVILVVRRRAAWGWAGLAAMAVQAIVWIGPVQALARGLVGSVAWVIMAHVMTTLLDRAARDAADFAAVERSASEWLASQDGRRRTRRVQVQRALAVAGPVLARTIETQGLLSPEEKCQARLAEGRIRDDLRGQRLLNDTVRDRIDAARRGGSHVMVLDEGGLEDLDDAALDTLRTELAAALEGATSERIYIRSSADAHFAVTVVGRSAHDGGEDTVELWSELERPGSSHAPSA